MCGGLLNLVLVDVTEENVEVLEGISGKDLGAGAGSDGAEHQLRDQLNPDREVVNASRSNNSSLA